ncbi:mechanosensitive ion channel [Candidatus Nitrospira allomarina]|uniref:Mechanosensitive ion channel n=1 Tax=Candidatus Nitrospira allomarina TaxID=3020900 RepID=A0AA96JSA1_9BACT|nr:mechanosensitive ion channel [Candidatus Nitrospira allomarina]WNM58377.1 mechanosensitive ion channel [Candidatus Nitrospira allomarina]
MSKLTETLQVNLGETLPNVLGALGILLLGWIVALLVRAGIRKALGMLNVNQRLRSTTGTTMDVEGGTAVGIYYLILLLVLVAFFNALHLEMVSGPLGTLVDQVMAFVPKLVAGGILMLIVWIIATVLRTLVAKALQSTTMDEKLSAGAGVRPISANLGNVVFWLVVLLFLPAILGTLEIDGLLVPVQNMVNEMLSMLPNIFGAVLIGVAGWFLAKIVRDLVSNLLTAAGTDRLGEQIGLRGTMSLSHLLALVVYILILVPAVVAALQALEIDVITGPATDMLNTMMSAIPDIFAAAIILGIAFAISRLVSQIVASLLGGLGFDALPEKLGLGQAFTGQTTPSSVVGSVLAFFIMLFAVVEAANQLGFHQVSELVTMFIEFGSQVLLGSAIIAIGFWLSNLAYETIIRVHGVNSGGVASIARFAILGLVLAMGLRAMGLANEIVNLAFGLTLGAIAVAVALSFGLGGREAAGKQMEYWLSQARGERRG